MHKIMSHQICLERTKNLFLCTHINGVRDILKRRKLSTRNSIRKAGLAVFQSGISNFWFRMLLRNFLLSEYFFQQKRNIQYHRITRRRRRILLLASPNVQVLLQLISFLWVDMINALYQKLMTYSKWCPVNCNTGYIESLLFLPLLWI